MKTIARRLRRLEDQLGTGDGKQRLLLVLRAAACRLAVDKDRCIEILGECGFLPTAPVGLVHLYKIPGGLTAKETERFLRERGAEICG